MPAAGRSPGCSVGHVLISRPLWTPVFRTDRTLARGCSESANTLFNQCRGYLLVIANQRLDDQLRAKLGGSDVVQQTLMHAHRDLNGFRGRSEGEFLAWLQRILLNEIARANRDYHATAKRDVSREIPLGQQNGSHLGGSWLPADVETPSKYAMASEQDALLQQALARLAPHYQRVIELRNRDLLSFGQIGERMAMSEEGARRLWTRAIERSAVANWQRKIRRRRRWLPIARTVGSSNRYLPNSTRRWSRVDRSTPSPSCPTISLTGCGCPGLRGQAACHVGRRQCATHRCPPRLSPAALGGRGIDSCGARVNWPLRNRA